MRDDLRAFVAEPPGDPEGFLVVDESGFLKKGAKSAGVQRQCSGAAGRTENCQIGVFPTYASPRGPTILDRALYLPASWTDDRARGRAAGIPDEVAFATKPAQAQAMLERALESSVPAAWVAADSSYGDVKDLRVWLEARPIAYVLAVSRKDTVAGPDWRRRRFAAYHYAPTDDGRQRLSQGGRGGGATRLQPAPPAAPRPARRRRRALGAAATQQRGPDRSHRLRQLLPAGDAPRRLVRVADARRTAEICCKEAKQWGGAASLRTRSAAGPAGTATSFSPACPTAS